jgi:hypothetical protein
MKIQMYPIDSFKFYASKVLAYVILIGIVTAAFATLQRTNCSAAYIQTTTRGY